MPNINLQNMVSLIIKYSITLFCLLILIILIKRYSTPENLKRIEPYKSIIVTVFSVLIFFLGFYFTGKDGNIYLAALYPLYVSIIVASLGAVKYRSLEIDLVPIKYLIKELKYGIISGFGFLTIIIIINSLHFFDSSLILALKLLFLGYLFNLGLVYYTYRKKIKK